MRQQTERKKITLKKKRKKKKYVNLEREEEETATGRAQIQREEKKGFTVLHGECNCRDMTGKL